MRILGYFKICSILNLYFFAFHQLNINKTLCICQIVVLLRTIRLYLTSVMSSGHIHMVVLAICVFMIPAYGNLFAQSVPSIVACTKVITHK